MQQATALTSLPAASPAGQRHSVDGVAWMDAARMRRGFCEIRAQMGSKGRKCGLSSSKMPAFARTP
jgi:hypothetical protein